jgi:predicted CopG family antitoxin
LNYNNTGTKRTTVSLDTKIYTRLKKHGKFGESFSRLIGRILDELEGGKVNG